MPFPAQAAAMRHASQAPSCTEGCSTLRYSAAMLLMAGGASPPEAGPRVRSKRQPAACQRSLPRMLTGMTVRAPVQAVPLPA